MIILNTIILLKVGKNRAFIQTKFQLDNSRRSGVTDQEVQNMLLHMTLSNIFKFKFKKAIIYKLLMKCFFCLFQVSTYELK